MCGLLGAVVGNVTNIKFSSFIKDGFVAGSLRGMDSCGIAVVDNKEDLDFHKLPVNGSTFIQDKRALAVIDKANTARTIIMTHTRAATVGRVTYNNAHPFYFNEVNKVGEITREFVGCHNGTLTISSRNPYDTDSEWGLEKIMQEGHEAFKSIRGAYCFTWWDSEDGEVLNIARNSDRDLNVAPLENGGLLYASEPGMLYWLAERNNLKLEKGIVGLLPGYHYKFNVKNPSNIDKVKLPEPITVVHNTNSRYHYKSHVDALQEFFDKIEKNEKKELKNEVNKANANAVQTARDYNLLGVKGEFMSIAYDAKANRCEGIFIAALTPGGEVLEWDAVINDYGKNGTLPDEIPWPVSVIGAIDDGANDSPMLLCSKPALSLVTYNKNKAVNH